MPSISPDSPKHDILAFLADIKHAEAQGLPPEEVFPVAPVERPKLSLDIPLIYPVAESVSDSRYNRSSSRFTNLAGKICLLSIGGAIFAAGSHSDELQAVLSDQSSAIPTTSADKSPVRAVESPSPSPSPTEVTVPTLAPSPSATPSLPPSPKPVSKIAKQQLVKPSLKPVVKASPKPVAPVFSQARFGRMKQYTVIENDFNIIAKDVSRISHEYHKPLTLARYNGIKDARSVKTGDKLNYRDCPTNGVMVNVDDTVSQLAEKYGTTTAKLHEVNGGAARAVAGWCIRIRLAATEAYPTNPPRK